MLFLGIRGRYTLPHHSFVLPSDYLKAFEDVFDRKVLPENPGIYVSNPCMHDPSLAPEGKSLLYVLVPVPNLSSGIDWKTDGPVLRGFRRDGRVRKHAQRT